MPRRNFLLTLAYDGTNFAGWQRLPGEQRTVQGTVEACLATLLGEPIELTGAGRTDRGVHAEAQAASFHSRTPLAPEELLGALRAALPADVTARSCVEVSPRFYARYGVKAKTYRYRLHIGKPEPSVRPTSLQVSTPLDLDAMRAAALLLEGEHDFSAFTNARDVATRRRVDAIRVVENGSFVDLLFVAKGFLYNQVRIMSGALLAVGEGRISPPEISRLLESGPRAEAPGALGPFGLCLVDVRY
ncbi:MAG TPA: tRNA pseudouridine(38-40) synthase TruA [Rectinemataceae bacterium]|nr:tRNA pseudouridine(38-40) synthase TruA [Rectinemataceae bacterium]